MRTVMSVAGARRAGAALLAGALLLAACGGDDPEDAASPSATATTASSPSPTPSPTPTGPLAPLTGEVVGEEDALRPALSVKIENTAKARPQAGLETADIVFEQLVEGGITRFLAVFQSEVPEQVGPIRSARLVDGDLLPPFRGILLYSGGRDDVQAAIAGGALRITEGASGVYRQSGRSAPSNLFADGPAVYETAGERDPELGPPPPWFTFDVEAPDGARDCAGADAGCDGERIDVSMSASNTAGWTYDTAEGVYRRDQNGTPQTTVSDVPVGAANVVVLATSSYQGGCCDTAGSPYVVTQTTGSGRAIVLRDGRWYEATWERPAAGSPLELSLDGRPLPLRPGPTWIHLAPSSRLPSATPAGEDG